MKLVTSTTLSLQSDLAPDTLHSCGIIHAYKSTNAEYGPQQDVFLWLANANVSGLAVGHLVQLGYAPESIEFIPYSSKNSWTANYPYLVPALECDAEGSVGAFRSNSTAASATKAASSTAVANPKKRKRGGPRIYKNAVLTNDLRDELHIQMYKYFQWLKHKLMAAQNTFNGRLKLNECGLTVLGIQSIISHMESIFSIVKPLSSGNTTNFDIWGDDTVPLLESALDEPLGKLADKRLEKTKPEPYHSQWYNFDDMYTKLQEYKVQKGHCNVPSRYAEDRRLGKWVQKLREKKTELDKKGLDFELPKGKLTGRTLTKERIDKLDSLGFEWRIKTKPRVSWDERFEELVQFYNMNGRWPSRSTDGEIGTWTHNQRNLHTKKDKHFMVERFTKLEAIGFDWDPTGKRAAKELSWSDGFEQLVNFGQTYGHFNVPPPHRNDPDGSRLHRFAQTLHMEHRTLQNGRATRMLNGDRVAALLSIGFKFEM